MLISAKQNLLVYSCLRCWDQHDEIVTDNIVWFNTDTMVASVKRGQDAVPVRINQFVFLANFPTTVARLKQQLPEALHSRIEHTEDASR